MRLLPLPLLVFLALGPAAASARAWRGIDPGVTSQADVVGRFGEPTTRAKRGGRVVLAYHGDEAPEGTRQAQFHLDADGTVQEITVFLATPLDAETIQGTYGKPPHRTFVEDTFQKVWVYPAQGVTVYFGKDGSVEALSFASGKAQAAPARPRPSAAPAAATPASPPAGAR
jgi:hypothetical protein